jgi:hypothetical protein
VRDDANNTPFSEKEEKKFLKYYVDNNSINDINQNKSKINTIRPLSKLNHRNKLVIDNDVKNRNNSNDFFDPFGYSDTPNSESSISVEEQEEGSKEEEEDSVNSSTIVSSISSSGSNNDDDDDNEEEEEEEEEEKKYNNSDSRPPSPNSNSSSLNSPLNSQDTPRTYYSFSGGGGNTPANKSKQTKTNIPQTYIEKKLILLHYIITDKFGQLNIDETEEDQSMRIQLQNDIYKKLDDQNIANEKLIENGRKMFNRNISKKLLKNYLTNDKFDKYLDYIEYHI